MRHLFILNPASGKRGSTQKIEALIAHFPHPHEVIYTTGVGDAWEIARTAAERGDPVRIYACGGDGTLNEVVNGAAGYPNAAVTNVPKGTGNDFIKIFGAEARPQFLNLAALAEGEETAFDLIDCNGRLAVDVVCGGVDARVGSDVHHYKKLPLVSGKGAYILSLITNIFFKGISRHMRVEMDGKVYEGETALLCICNGRYYGGGFQPVPEAMPDDGVLDALLIADIGLFTLLTLVGKYAKGRYKELSPYVKDFHGQHISLTSHLPITVVVDGETMRDTSFVFQLSDKKINFFYPRGLTYNVQQVAQIVNHS